LQRQPFATTLVSHAGHLTTERDEEKRWMRYQFRRPGIGSAMHALRRKTRCRDADGLGIS
jgi:hypothetical protein